MSKKNGNQTKEKSGPRCVALVGPYGAGKTTLLESLAWVTNAIPRKGEIAVKNTLGDFSPEARARQMSVEANVATLDYLGESITFIDCPGSIEFLQDALNVLPGVDAAIVVCEPDAAKVGHAAALSEAPRRCGHSAHAVRQQGGQSHKLHPRIAADVAAGFRKAAAAPPNSDLEPGCGERLRRSRAGARLCLPPACGVRAGGDGGRDQGS